MEPPWGCPTRSSGPQWSSHWCPPYTHMTLVDNCSALSACVHGYADKLDMAKMANSVRLALRFLGVRLRFNGAPTDANIADTPSRVERDYETSRGVRSGTRRYDAT